MTTTEIANARRRRRCSTLRLHTRNGIVPARVPGVTAEDPPYRYHQAASGSVLLDGFDGEGGARRREAADRRQQRRQQEPVEAENEDDGPGAQTRTEEVSERPRGRGLSRI